MTTRSTYEIQTQHQTVSGPSIQSRTVTVTTNKKHLTNRLVKCVSSPDFGCRDYETPSDTIAITNLLNEYAMRMLKMKKISEQSY